MKIISYLCLTILLISSLHAEADFKLFDMPKMLDASTLKTKVISDWHAVDGVVPTRQKIIEITVGEGAPGKDYRVMVQFAVPKDKKATGVYLTSGVSNKDMKISKPDAELIKAGVGLVKTHINSLKGELKNSRNDAFYKTLDPRYRNFWIWPATFMRTITAAHAETEYFEKGKVLVSGTSKVGETSAVTLINDKRVTAAFGRVCPLYASPVRLSNPEALAKLAAYNNSQKKKKGSARGLGGLAGPSMKAGAIAAGKTAKQLQDFADKLADQLFISRNVDKLKARGADFLFHPGTHDWVSYDGIWGGMNAANVPVYNAANSGHGKKGHPSNLREANSAAFMMNHFTGGKAKILEPPTLSTKINNNTLKVAVTFKAGSNENSGRAFWIYDRAPDATSAYLEELIPEENWRDMTYDKASNTWTVEIPLDKNAKHIDVFSNHQKNLTINGKKYTMALSSPYTRVKLPSQ